MGHPIGFSVNPFLLTSLGRMLSADNVALSDLSCVKSVASEVVSYWSNVSDSSLRQDKDRDIATSTQYSHMS